jgi:hypothetical protein
MVTGRPLPLPKSRLGVARLGFGHRRDDDLRCINLLVKAPEARLRIGGASLD